MTTPSLKTPAKCCGSFFYDNTLSIAAALDIQNALQAALPLAQDANEAAQKALSDAQQALINANYFLTGDLRGLPTSDEGLPSGTLWNNGGTIAVV